MEDKTTRRTPRYSLVADIELTDVQSAVRIKARTKVLSTCGCSVNSLEFFPLGSRVRIKVSHHNQEANVLARVVYSDSVGMGFAFLFVEPIDQHILESWIADLERLRVR